MTPESARSWLRTAGLLTAGSGVLLALHALPPAVWLADLFTHAAFLPQGAASPAAATRPRSSPVSPAASPSGSGPSSG
jgi:hypothetical protein